MAEKDRDPVCVEIDTLWNVKEDVNLYLNLIVS